METTEHEFYLHPFLNPRFVRTARFSRFPFAKLGNPREIERLRWDAILRMSSLYDRNVEIVDEMIALGGEVFVPPDDSDTEYFGEALPRRIYVAQDYTGNWVGYDDNFWSFKPSKHKGSPLEVIAAAGEEGEWKKIILLERKARATPERLDVGLRYERLQQRLYAQREHCWKLNQALYLSVTYCGVLPENPRLGEKLVFVEINERRYPFRLKSTYAEADYENWPMPDDHDTVMIPKTWEFDDSLIGQTHDVVRTRHGKPDKKVRKGGSWDGNVWIYGNVGIAFADGVVSHYLDEEAVLRLTGIFLD